MFTIMGVGGCGSNAVDCIQQSGLSGVDLIVANTDRHALERSHVPVKMLLGDSGLGCGRNPRIGRASALHSERLIQERLTGCRVLLIFAGMGGGAGTGASPMIASIAREMGILTAGIVTTPFEFEGKEANEVAQSGITELAAVLDALIVIPNDVLMHTMDNEVTLDQCFGEMDALLRMIAVGLLDILGRRSSTHA